MALGTFINATLSLYADTIVFGFCLEVSLMSWNSDCVFSSPSMIKVPLKILCLQCSLLT